MAYSEIPTGFLALRPGTFGRTTRATREGAVRAINISNCPVTRWSVIGLIGDDISDKLDGHSFRVDEQLDVSIMEAKLRGILWGEDAEKIGSLNTDSMRVNLHLQPDAFAFFWTAAEATDGSTRNMELVLKPDGQDILTVTNIGLFEAMPDSTVHPVVAELRLMREKLSGMARLIVVAFYIFVAVWVLLKIFR